MWVQWCLLLKVKARNLIVATTSMLRSGMGHNVRYLLDLFLKKGYPILLILGVTKMYPVNGLTVNLFLKADK